MFGNLGVHVIKYPSGRYGFVGSISVQCLWINKDGSELTDAQAREVAQANIPSMLAKSRSFETEAAAWAFYNELTK